ncbi:hypothetical protein [Nocardioides sp.]|uniref:hypothetical protein n=1 Tax=Nocardioides sp. TaxID=35761 RepID=UPI00272062AC|nr:hypothetical protein [Nocardioides sp.]MDO9458113.1 hypothetical protein [Nocardioides sp.]
MTDIKQLLHEVSDITVPVDVAADLARGRAAAHHRRAVLAAVGAAAAVVAVTVGGYAVVTGDDGDAGSSGFATSSVAPTSDPPTSRPTAPPTTPPATPHETVTAAPVDPATLVHTPFFDVPPPPRGWYLVGGQEPYVMFARDGSDADLTGGFSGRLMVLLGSPDEALPGDAATPLDLDGRTFYLTPADAGATQIRVERDNGEWLTVQYPVAAGFDVADMVAFLAGVRVLPGAMAAS